MTKNDPFKARVRGWRAGEAGQGGRAGPGTPQPPLRHFSPLCLPSQVSSGYVPPPVTTPFISKSSTKPATGGTAPLPPWKSPSSSQPVSQAQPQSQTQFHVQSQPQAKPQAPPQPSESQQTAAPPTAASARTPGSRRRLQALASALRLLLRLLGERRALGNRDILSVAVSWGFKQRVLVDRVRAENWLGQAALAWRPWLWACPIRDGPSGPGGAAPGGSTGSGTGLSAGRWVCRRAE